MGEKDHDVGEIRAARPQPLNKESRKPLKALRFLAVTVGLFIILAIVLLPLIDQFVASYSETLHAGKVPVDIRAMVSEDLVELLSSRNVQAVAFAVQELGKRHAVRASPQLIEMLNRHDPVDIPGAVATTSIARLAATALTSITRRQVELHPGNIAILRQLFQSADSGTVFERTGARAVLKRIHEPLAAYLNSKPAAHGAGQPRDSTTHAVVKLQEPHKDDVLSVVLRRSETGYLAVLCAIIAVALGTTITWICGRTPAQSVLLLCMPLILIVWITLMAGIDFSMGIAVDDALDKAVQEGNFLSLKTMLYDEYVPYPGDSYVARYLVGKGSNQVVYCLTQLPAAGPDDDKNYRKFLTQRIEWILSRIVAIKLCKGTLDELSAGDLPDVKAALAVTLGRLGAKNEAILKTLERLSLDSDEEVRGKASKALARVKKYPSWSWAPRSSNPKS